MVDINLLPDNLREREEKAKRDAAKQPHEPQFALTNPPPLTTSRAAGPTAPKPSPVTRAALAAPPLPPTVPAAVAVRPKPSPPPAVSTGPLHAAPRVGADAARVNLLRQPTLPTAPLREAMAAAATAEAEAMLSAAVKRELARTPLAVPALAPRRRGFWVWLRSLFTRHPRAVLPPVPKVVVLPPPLAQPAAPRPPSARLAPPVPMAGKTVRPAVPTPPPVAPAVVHAPAPHARAKRRWWPWHRRPRIPAAPQPFAARPQAVLPPTPPAIVARVMGVPAVAAPRRHRRGLWAWLRSLLAHQPRAPKLPPVPVVVLPWPAPAAPKPPVSPVGPRAAPPAVGAPAPIKPALPGIPAAVPARPPLPPAPAVGSPLRVTPELRPARGAVGRPVRTLAVNLIPTDLSASADPRQRGRLIGLAAVAVASALVVVGLQQWVRWYEVQIGTQVKATEAQISQLTAAIAGYEQFRLEGLALQTQLKTVEAALGRHLYWTKIFGQLERYTIPEVYYTSFAASVDGNLTLAAVGKDYGSVARQLVAFQEAKDFVSSVTITSASAEYTPLPPGVVAQRRQTAPPGAAVADETIAATHFQVSLTLLPEVFLQQFVTQRAP